MLRHLERWPTVTHQLPQYTAYVGSSEKDVAPVPRTVGQLLNER